MSNDLTWSWCNNRNNVHDNVLESSQSHPPPLLPLASAHPPAPTQPQDQVHGKTVFHETSPWCQNGQGLQEAKRLQREPALPTIPWSRTFHLQGWQQINVCSLSLLLYGILLQQQEQTRTCEKRYFDLGWPQPATTWSRAWVPSPRLRLGIALDPSQWQGP